MHLVTQNIDDLHQRAGSSRVTAMPGEVGKIRDVRSLSSVKVRVSNALATGGGDAKCLFSHRIPLR